MKKDKENTQLQLQKIFFHKFNDDFLEKLKKYASFGGLIT